MGRRGRPRERSSSELVPRTATVARPAGGGGAGSGQKTERKREGAGGGGWSGEEEEEDDTRYRYKTSAPRSVASSLVSRSVTPTYLPRQRHLDATFFTARHLGAKTYGAETCYLGAVGHGADP